MEKGKLCNVIVRCLSRLLVHVVMKFLMLLCACVCAFVYPGGVRNSKRYNVRIRRWICKNECGLTMPDSGCYGMRVARELSSSYRYIGMISQYLHLVPKIEDNSASGVPIATRA